MAWGTILASTLFICFVMIAWAQDDIREPPRILEPLAAQTKFYKKGSIVTLMCNATGKPNPTYEWYWNDVKLEPHAGDGKSYDPATGVLTIRDFTVPKEGYFNCRAKNTFPNQLHAVAVSPKIEARVGRLETLSTPNEERTKNVNEGSYASIRCDDTLPESMGPTTFVWYDVRGLDQMKVLQENERIFVDNEGTLHLTYVRRSDQLPSNGQYVCGVSSVLAGKSELLKRRTKLVVKSSSIRESPPMLQYSTLKQGPQALTFKRNTKARLECVFSGYVNKFADKDKVPAITWQDNAGNNIISGQGHYTIERYGRVLLIENLVEADERTYTCIGANKLNMDKETMMLNVTSAPIWVKPLQFVTVPQGQDAVFHCEARSAASEIPPNEPRWMKNGIRLDLSYDPEKYVFTEGKRVLTVKSVQKSTDITCFQCYVSNSEGEEFGNGCLNVILPIRILTQPHAVQSVERGDVVDLTVVATSDRLYPLSYKWIFKNKTYELDQAPPHVFYDVNSKVAYINTSGLSDQEMRSITGLYRREVFHQFQMEVVNVEVKLKGDPDVVAVSGAGFDFWIIGLVLGILLLLVIILIVSCVLCRRKMQEGVYPVDKKETSAGLDPEKELKKSGFHDLSRADCDDVYPDEKKASVLNIHNIPGGERDDESFGSAEYYAEQTAFNEDGSFIGVYQSRVQEQTGPPAHRPAIESNV